MKPEISHGYSNNLWGWSEYAISKDKYVDQRSLEETEKNSTCIIGIAHSWFMLTSTEGIPYNLARHHTFSSQAFEISTWFSSSQAFEIKLKSFRPLNTLK